MINGKVHSWEQISVYLNGVPIAGIKEINYKSEREAEAIYGAGKYPLGVGTGNYKVEGDITLTKEEYDKLMAVIKADGGLSIYNLVPVDIVVVYSDPVRTGNVYTFQPNPLRTEVIKNAVFTSEEWGHSQNDKESVVKLSFIAEKMEVGA